MAELTTTRLAMPYPDAAEPANPPADFQQLAQKVADVVAGWLPSGTLAARPAPVAALDRHFYFAHDTGAIYACVDAGNDASWAWVEVYPFTQSVNWADIVGKPATFPPSTHSHGIADLPVAASGTSNTTQVVRADDSRLSNERTPVNGSVTFAKLAAAAVADSGVSSSTAVVRADDARLSNARTPTAHSHSIGDLPVAASGTSNTTQVVRADDARLSNARTPTGTAGGVLSGTYPNPGFAASPTFSGTTTVDALNVTGNADVGNANTDLLYQQSMEIEDHTRNHTITYNADGTVNVIEERDGTTVLRTLTHAYSGGNLSTVTEVAGGKTITTTFGYTGSQLTSITRSVA